MIKLPPNNQWVQNNQNPKFGSIWSSFNLNLTDEGGVLRVSPKLMLTNDNTTDLGAASAFAKFYRNYNQNFSRYMVSGKFLWKATAADGYVTAFAKDTITGTPTGSADDNSCADDISDMITYGSETSISAGDVFLILTTKTNLYYLDTTLNTWNAVGVGSINSGGPHMLTSFLDRIYVTDGWEKVRSTTTAFGALTTSGSYFLNLKATGKSQSGITCLRAVTDGIWIFTINNNESGCWAFKWDGASASPTSYHYLRDSNGILASVIINDTPWVIDNNGRLLYFNGGTFVEVPNGKLPVKNAKLLKNSLSGSNNRWIHPNGIAVYNNRINIFINSQNNDSGATREENIASGIWEFDPKIGWYHKNSVSMQTVAGSLNDYGQNQIKTAGALFMNKNGSSSATTQGTTLVGAEYYSDATTSKYGVWTDNTNNNLPKYGYLVTPKIFSSNIEDIWQKVIVRNKKLLNSTDSITVKYRVSDVEPTSGTITWTSTTSFTSTADLSAYAVGDEVEIVQGNGGGKCSHISSISYSNPTYTVSVDETYSNITSGTAIARFQKWKKVGQLTSQTKKWFESVVGVNDTWIQLKICMAFTGKDEIDDILIEQTKSK